MQEYGIPLLVDQKSFLCISVTVGESMQWKKRSNEELPSGNFSRSRAHEWRPAGKFQRQVRIVQGVCIVKVRFWRQPGHQGLRHHQPHTIEGRGNCHSTLYSGVADRWQWLQTLPGSRHLPPLDELFYGDALGIWGRRWMTKITVAQNDSMWKPYI